jgi:hypothetical protein
MTEAVVKKTNPLLGKARVKPCTCISNYQDRVYGRGKRLHNICLRSGGGLACRCTVCSNEQDI